MAPLPTQQTTKKTMVYISYTYLLRYKKLLNIFSVKEKSLLPQVMVGFKQLF
jgi:hypothetical protein